MINMSYLTISEHQQTFCKYDPHIKIKITVAYQNWHQLNQKLRWV